MSRPKLSADRIPAIFEHLHNDPQPFYNCAEIQALWGYRKSAAIKLMDKMGAEIRNGVEAVVSRENQMQYLLTMPETKQCIEKYERRKCTAAQLQQIQEEERQKAIPIAGVRRSDEWIGWADLPQVRITAATPESPGRMEITFKSAAHLALTLWQMSRAMANEHEAFLRMCGIAEVPEIQDKAKALKAALAEMLRKATPEERERLTAETRNDPTPKEQVN